MEPRTLQSIAHACAGELLTGPANALVVRICTDSRHVAKGDLFVALRGERFDGHNFLADVAQKGAIAAMVDRGGLPRTTTSLAVIAVDNTRAALGRLAAEYRREFTVPIVAVAGSNGKTTTKELIAAALRPRWATLWSEASFNNDIGVPLTVLNLERRHQAAVLELGTNHPGELAPLVTMVQPRFGVLTSIGREHLEFFGDLAGVAKEEGTLAELLPPEGRLFLNATTEQAEQIARRSRAPVVRIGWDSANDWSAERIQADDQGTLFVVRARRAGFSGEFRVNLLGRHQVLNALLALAVSAEMGVNANEARRGLLECQPLKMRLQLWEAHGVRVLDDSYNANADSMLAAMQTLHDLPCAGRRVAVLGDMAELGEQAAPAHAEVGRRAGEFGVNQLCAVGKMAQVTARAARDTGLRNVREFADVTEAASAIPNLVRRDDLVLLKASRAVGLERVSAALRQVRVPPSGGGSAGSNLRVEASRAVPPEGGTRTEHAQFASIC